LINLKKSKILDSLRLFDSISFPCIKEPFKHIDKQTNKLTRIVQIAPYLLIAICLAVILVFVLLAQYAHPASDDFCMASGVNNHGLFRFLWLHYFEWSGRYTGNALYAIYPLIFDLFDGYKYIPAILILTLFLAMAFFLSSLFRVSLYARPVLLVSLCFVCVFLLGMLSPASSLYWMAGAFSYQTANALFLVVSGLMFQLADHQKESKNYFALLAFLLLLMALAIGMNETSMLALAALALLGFVIHLCSGWPVLKPWLVILVVTMFCFAMVYFSPGNAIRTTDFPLRHDFARSVNGSLSVGLKILWLWLSNPLLIISGMLVPFAIAGLFSVSGRQWSDRSFTVSKTMIAALMLCTVVIPVVLQFPAWWAMGGWPPARTVDAIYFLFILSWYLTIAAFTLHYLCKGKWTLIRQPNHPAVAIVLLLLSSLFAAAVFESKAYQLAKNDLSHLAGPYHDYMKTRYRLIEQAKAKGQNYLTVADFLQEYPRSIYFNDIMQNPDHWRNGCYANYFGLDKINRK
jgi:hypothetical protein